MRISLGLSCANSAVLGTRPTKSAEARIERRDQKAMITSTHRAAITPKRGGRIDEKAGVFKTTRPRLMATGRAPTALAAFVKRPQAARSNRRYVLKLKGYFGASMKWNGKFRKPGGTGVPHSVQIVK